MKKNDQKSVVEFFEKYPIRKYAKGQILLHFDERAPHVFYLQSGKVRQYNIADNGTEIVLNIFRQNAYFPVYLALSQVPNGYIYEAMTEIELRKAPVREFCQFFKQSPDIVYEHLIEVYQRSNKALKRMTFAVGSSAYYRIIFELINECSFIKPRKDKSYHVHLHEYEIADCAGLSRETASRQFQILKEKKLVSVTRKFITVKNLAKLKKELGDHI